MDSLERVCHGDRCSEVGMKSFQDEESMLALSHLIHVNQHYCGKNQKGKLVLGVRGHTGFQIFATYFGF